ncbi:putative isomerase YbhE [Xylaria sp. FL0043]|nr:putative isomerase YbhE [Xylaria sp. FL0043]
MLRQTLTTLLLGSMATAAPAAIPSLTPMVAVRQLVVGGPAQILRVNFNGSSFEIKGKNVTAGTGPSWLRYKPSTKTLYAVDENGSNLNKFTIDPVSMSDLTYVSSTNGSSGVVFLEFNKDQTRMVGAAYGSAMLDVWDVSTDAPKLLKQIVVDGPLGPNQSAHHPHQALFDPSGRFVVVPDLGGDQLLILDAKDDKYEISSRVTLFAGAGPRHGGFITAGDKTFYAVACELSSVVALYELEYAGDNLGFKYISTQSTYGPGFPPANASSAAAGELVVAANNKDVYISNRLSGNATDSISHFVFDANNTASLTWTSQASSHGVLPRGVSLSNEEGQNVMFVANQGGDNGLVALHRCNVTGQLAAEPVAAKALSELIAPGLETQVNAGPEFVQQIY